MDLNNNSASKGCQIAFLDLRALLGDGHPASLEEIFAAYGSLGDAEARDFLEFALQQNLGDALAIQRSREALARLHEALKSSKAHMASLMPYR